MQVYKATGRMPAQLRDQPELPEELQYIWDFFQDIRGSQPLTFTEIKNWSELKRVELEAREVDLLRSIDLIFWRVLHER